MTNKLGLYCVQIIHKNAILSALDNTIDEINLHSNLLNYFQNKILILTSNI